MWTRRARLAPGPGRAANRTLARLPQRYHWQRFRYVFRGNQRGLLGTDHERQLKKNLRINFCAHAKIFGIVDFSRTMGRRRLTADSQLTW
jgi:hypothetical protein